MAYQYLSYFAHGTELKFYHGVYQLNINPEYLHCRSQVDIPSQSQTNLNFVTKCELSKSWSKDM